MSDRNDRDRNDRDRNDGGRRGVSRRRFLQGSATAAGAIAIGAGNWVVPARWAHAAGPIKIGIATDITGPIGYAGNACWNTAQLVAKQINDAGGIVGRPVELYLEDTASNESIAVGNVRRLIQQHQVDMVVGGITSSMRQAIKDPIVRRGRTIYIYPQLYEGEECTQYLFNTGPTPAQQCDRLIPWLVEQGNKRFALPSANYVWPNLLNKYARKVIEENGGEVVFEEYYPLDQIEYSATVARIMNDNVDCVFNTVIPPGVGPFFKQLYEAGFHRRGGRLCCVYYDENLLNVNTPAEMEGLASCLDFFQDIEDPFSQQILADYRAMFPDTPYQFTAGSAATGTWRGLKLYEQALIATNGDTDRDAVNEAMQTATIPQGPGGGAEMVPQKWHCKMNMYIAVAHNGQYDVVEKFDMVDPQEC